MSDAWADISDADTVSHGGAPRTQLSHSKSAERLESLKALHASLIADIAAVEAGHIGDNVVEPEKLRELLGHAEALISKLQAEDAPRE